MMAEVGYIRLRLVEGWGEGDHELEWIRPNPLTPALSPVGRGSTAALRASSEFSDGAFYDIVSRSSSLRCPGTMATGIGKSPAVLARLETRGPGPSLPVPAARISAAISSSSSISLS